MTIQPAPELVFANFDYQDSTSLYIWPAGGLRPATAYTVTLNPGLRSAFGDPLTEPYTVTFETGALPPLVELQGGNFQVSTFATITPTVQVIAYRNVERLRLRLYRLAPERFIHLVTDWEAWYTYDAQQDELVREWTLEALDAAPNELGFVRTLIAPEGERLPPGFYVLIADTPARRVEPSKRLTATGSGATRAFY
ncbi:MAG: hypothetical protein Q9O62_08830 [Ardenticatenia bacterium]|nr:hypothetical protein [Ardenticatenia bacterium]